MHSYDIFLWLEGTNLDVLILVVMEDALVHDIDLEKVEIKPS